MKKFLAILLAFAFVLSMTGCKAGETDPTDSSGKVAAKPSEEGTQAPATTTPGDLEPSEGQTSPTQAPPATTTTTSPEPSEPTKSTTSAHEHQYDSSRTYPTCTERGYTTYTCSCGYSTIGDYVSATGHTWGDWRTLQQPTTTAYGKEERACTVCGLKESRTLDKLPPETAPAKGYAAGYSGGMGGSGAIIAYGVDVSEHQGSGFDFQNLKNNGYSYVIIRCGFCDRKDYRFEEYYAAAKAAGLDVGVYFYSYAQDAEFASYEADRCLEYIQGKQFEYPIYFDFEDPSAKSYDGALATAICSAFLSKIEAAGYLPGLYSGAGWIDPSPRYNGWVPAASICTKWECWIANYWDHTPTNEVSVNYPSTYGMYQYTSGNYIGGVGPLDTNVCYKDYPTIVKTYHFNGY